MGRAGSLVRRAQPAHDQLLRHRRGGRPVGITAREKSIIPKTLVQEVATNKPGVRVFVVHSEEREAYERAQRDKSKGRVHKKLEALQRRITSGRLKAPEKVGAAAGAILKRNHGPRYYDWS